ncbi:hypothetical protein ACMA1D_02070 [Streptomyces sp. 796.1]|uniref:RapZ C-terminal domain-containing protein n=1 Tax=Streptomyces sp. 796.1 TaxID=3163029 RepID=UPI0039C96897
MLVRVISFGYGHTGTLADDDHTPLEPPTADITLDLRRTLHDPHRNPAMRHLTGLDAPVYAHVLATPGARLLAHTTALAAHTLATEAQRSVVVAVGCVGGRHRAVGVAREIHRSLAAFAAAGAYTADLVHRDVHRPVLPAARHAELDARAAARRQRSEGAAE